MSHKQDRLRAKAGLVFRDGKLVPKDAVEQVWNQKKKEVQNGNL